jgi:Tol biopolymer transport system component
MKDSHTTQIPVRFLSIVLLVITSVTALGFQSAFAQVEVTLIPGTVIPSPEVENAVRQVLSEGRDVEMKGDYYAITDVREEEDWFFVSIIGLMGLEDTLDWNLDNASWFGLVLLHKNLDGSFSGGIRGSESFSSLLESVPEDVLTQDGKADLDPQLQVQEDAVSYTFPWQSGFKMYYGYLGVHTNGWYTGWKAVDLLSGGNTAAGQAPNRMLASAPGTINYKCTPAEGDVSTAIRIGDLMYTHVVDDPGIQTGRSYNRGEFIGPMAVGNFSEKCGYASQGDTWFHVHLGFPDTGTVTFEGWTLNLATEVWTKGNETRSPGEWIQSQSGLGAAGTTSRASIGPGGAQGNNSSSVPSVSADGRYLAFDSNASNLVIGDTNGVSDVFVQDRQTGETTRVSVSSGGSQGNEVSNSPSISAGGRYVAFHSQADNLVSGDTNGKGDIFVHDRLAGETTRVSVSSTGIQANKSSFSPSISADGRYITFSSYATNLVSGDTNSNQDVFVHDRLTGDTTRASVSSGGNQGNAKSWNPSISANGRYVVFNSTAGNLVIGDSNGYADIFVRDRVTEMTTRVSVASDGTQGNQHSWNPSVSADGDYVVFESEADNLVSGDTNSVRDVFIHQPQTGMTTRLSVSSDNAQGNGASKNPSITYDGQVVAFNSSATNLVDGDTNGRMDVFVHDRGNGETTRVSTTSSGNQGNYHSHKPSISAKGRYVGFESNASNLVSGDTNGAWDVFIHDRGTTTTPPEKSPLILVHGLQGFSTPGQDCDQGMEKYDGSNSTLGELGDWFALDGYEVWIAHLTTNASGTPPLEDNARCLAGQIYYVASQHEQPVIIVSHAMGGAVGRAALQFLEPGTVSELYTLGSPHAGLPSTSLGSSGIWLYADPNQQAARQMSAPGVSAFNTYYPNLNGVDYAFIGGDSTPGLQGWLLKSQGAGENDGLVGKYSAVGWVFPDTTYSPAGWTSASAPGQYWTDESHSSDIDPDLNYYSTRTDSSKSHAYRCMAALMSGGTPSTAYCQTASAPVPAPGAAAPDIPEMTIVQSGHLGAGGSVSVPLDVDTTGASLFTLTWDGSAPVFTLTRPDATVIDPAYASAHPDEVTYQVNAGGTDVAPYAAYGFNSTLAGEWSLDISAVGAVDYHAFAALESTRDFSIQMDKTVYANGDSAALTATLTSGGSALTGATVSADFNRPDGVTDTVSLTDQGDGTYTGSYTIPDAPGYLSVTATATGMDGGTSYTRQEELTVTIAPHDAAFTGTYASSPRDANGDGLYEILDFQAEVNAGSRGEYAVFAELTAGGQTVNRTGAFNLLDAGTQTITLQFDGKTIRDAGLDGPYTITHLTLTPVGVGVHADAVDDVHTTSAYGDQDFGLDDTPPRVTNLNTNADTGDGELSDFEITMAFITQFTVTYSEAMSDDAGPNPDDVTKKTNYSLTDLGADGLPGGGDDTHVTVDAVTYNSSTKIATISVNGGIPLPPGDYQWRVNGSSSVKDLTGNRLDGDGDGWGGDDLILHFFVILAPPPAPTLVSPSGVIGDRTPTYKWNTVDGTTQYKLLVYFEGTSSYVIAETVPAPGNCSGGVCAYTPSTVLDLGNYKFKVKAYNSAGWGPASEWMGFRYGPPDAPTLISPSGTIVDSTPTFKWNGSSGARTYRLTVYSIDSSSYVVSEDLDAYTHCSSGTCSYTSPTPLVQGNYRFKVRARNGAGWGPISSWMKFKYGPPDAPTLISPSGTIATGSPTYKWKMVSGATLYRISVYSIDTSSYVITENVVASTTCTGSTCAYKPTTTLSQGNYRFKVRARNVIGWSPISGWMAFKYGPPDAPKLTAPSGVIATSSPTYGWNAVDSATLYRLSVYSIDTSSYVITENVDRGTTCTGATCEYKPSTTLIQGNYQFKVRARNGVGWGPISSWMAFKYGPPDAPTLISPNNPISDTTPKYRWNASAGATLYKLMVYSVAASGNVIDENLLFSDICSGGVCAYTPSTALIAGDYRFKVKPYNNAGWGPVSAWMSFEVVTDPPGVPTLISPSGVIGDSTPTYKWNQVDTATVYKVSLYSETTSSYVFSKNVSASSVCWGGVCNYTPTSPLAQGSYRFQVNGHNLIGWGPMSSWMMFRYGTPDAPALISPIGTITDTTPTYQWNESEGGTRYMLIVYSITAGSNVITENLHFGGICSGGVCAYTPSTALIAGDFRFKVKAYNKAGWGPVSAWMSFEVVTDPPGTPTLVAPSGVIGDSTPAYKWNQVDTATVYKVSLYSETTSSNVFSQNVTDSSMCWGGVCNYTPTTPLAQGDYRFKVRASNEVGWGPVSSWMMFRYGPPDAPTLISPSGTISETTPTYQWNESEGGTRYMLTVYSITIGSNVITENLHFSGICSGGVCAYTPSTVLIAGDYRFNVKAYNNAGWGPVSAWMEYTVSP